MGRAPEGLVEQLHSSRSGRPAGSPALPLAVLARIRDRVWACASTLKKLMGTALMLLFTKWQLHCSLPSARRCASGSSIVFSVAGAARPRTRPASTCMLPATLQASTASASIAHLDTIPAPALSTTASCLSLFYYLSHRFGASLHFPFRTQKYYSRLVVYSGIVVRGTGYTVGLQYP